MDQTRRADIDQFREAERARGTSKLALFFFFFVVSFQFQWLALGFELVALPPRNDRALSPVDVYIADRYS